MDETWNLFREASDGDPDALNRLFERVRTRLVLWVSIRLSRKLRALVEPEDVVQEVFYSAVRDFGNLRATDVRGFLKWLFRIAENRIRDLADHFGAKKRQPTMPVMPSQTTPGTRLVRSEQVRILMAALHELPEDYRRVIRLRLLEERDTAEIAEVMDRSENSIRILLCRALKALRKIMGTGESGSAEND